MSESDDLFSAEKAAPISDRLGKATVALAVAAPLNVLGITCFTGVPGALLSLWGWQIADEELHRVEIGALPADRERRARLLRTVGFTQMGVASMSLIAQLVLFGLGFYDGVLQVVLALAGIG